jgi:glycosyltransferase involved in cell wall biosynthesis
MEKPLWSISIICKNEELTLPKLLASLKEYILSGGEIVVVDTGSTDGTVNLLRNLGFLDINKMEYDVLIPQLRYTEVGNRFSILLDDITAKSINSRFLVEGDEPFIKDEGVKSIFNFGAARSYAGKLCSNDWILSIDCDEVVKFMDIKTINQRIRVGDIHQFSFNFRYCDPKGNVTSSTTRDKFYNREYADWKWVVHEQVKPLKYNFEKFNNSENFSSYLQNDILSLDHYQDLLQSSDHRSNYLIAMCVDVLNCESVTISGKDDNDQHYHWLGREMMYKGHNFSAIKLLKEYLNKYPDVWAAERCMSCIFIGDCYINIFKNSKNIIPKSDNLERKGLAWYFKATLYEKSFREPWMKLAEYFFEKKDFFRSIQFLESALRIIEIPRNYMNDLTVYGSRPHKLYYTSLRFSGKIDLTEKAFKYWCKTKNIYPHDQTISCDESLF